MAHRGRLNVLANFLRKSLKIIFTEFSENYIPDLVAGDGDVKYHLGYQAVRRFASGNESRSDSRRTEPFGKLSIQSSRGKRAPGNEFAAIRAPEKGLAAADTRRCGVYRQGIVAETLNLSQLHGYSTGGTIHVVGEQSDRLHDASERCAIHLVTPRISPK